MTLVGPAGFVPLAIAAVVQSSGGQVSPSMLEAAKASPALVGELSKEIGSTPEQAAGAAGALFGVAKSRLKPEEFSQVSSAVPGMDLLLKAAPAMTGTAGAMSSMAGSAGGLSSVAAAFSKLGPKPDMVAKAVPILTSFVTKSGGQSRQSSRKRLEIG